MGVREREESRELPRYGLVQSVGNGAIHRVGKVMGGPGGRWHWWETRNLFWTL